VSFYFSIAERIALPKAVFTQVPSLDVTFVAASRRKQALAGDDKPKKEGRRNESFA
jgi:hypothetical protein